MTPELLYLYNELYITAAYFYQNPRQPGLHLIVNEKPKMILAYEVGEPEVRRNHLLPLFGSEDLQHTLPEIELFLYQLPVIKYRGKKPYGDLPEV